MRIVNLTPHPISIIRMDEGITMELPSEGSARVATSSIRVGEINNVPVNRRQFGEVTGLPDPVDGVVLLVSRIVAEAAGDRDDLIMVDETIRDQDGRIVGAAAFSRL